MQEYLIIVATCLVIFVGSFLIGFWISKAMKGHNDKDANDDQDKQYLYCFQCEFEMSVKVKNGNMYCANCGLRH
jgi:hypothetical protein